MSDDSKRGAPPPSGDPGPGGDSGKPRRPDLTGKVLGGIFWQAGGTAINVVLQLLVLAVLARLLGPTEFGLIASTMIVIALPGVFSESGINRFVVRAPRLTDRYVRTVFALAVWINLILALALIGLAPAIALFFRSDDLVPVLRTASPLFVLVGLSIVPRSLLEREFQFKSLARIRVLSYAVGYGLVGITLALLGLGVYSLVAANLALQLLSVILLLRKRPHPRGLVPELPIAREVAAYTLGLGLGWIANYLALQGDRIIVGRFLGPATLGFYSRAYRLMTAPANLFGKVVNTVLLPALSQIQDQPERLAPAFRRAVASTALIALPVSTILVVLGPEIVALMLGPKWTAVVPPLQILAAGAYFRVGYKISGTLAIATGAVYRLAWIQWVYATIVLSGAWLGSRHGMAGVALAVVAALLVQFVLLSRLGMRLAGLSIGAFLSANVAALPVAAVTGGVCWTVAWVTRSRGLPHYATLLLAMTATGLVLLPAARLLPAVFLGRDGRWWMSTLEGRLPAGLRGKLRRFV